TSIARSKKEIEIIIDIAKEFFKINNIEINTKKSELLIIYLKNKEDADKGLKFGLKEKIVPRKRPEELSRYLEI
ncbi:16271_t:CDS:1, partial [Racocetra persica]